MSNISVECPLETVLRLCENLHKANSSSSRRLLVPLHQSLCQAVQWSRREEETVPDLGGGNDIGLPLEDVIAGVCTNPGDATLCRTILLESNANAENRQLATIQYLLFQPALCRRPLRGLAFLVIPWLLDCFHPNIKSDDTDDDMPHSIAPTVLEFLETVLDAVFITTTEEGSVEDGLSRCLEVCSQKVSTTRASEWCWTVQGRVLMRLHSWLLEQRSPQADSVLETLQTKCTQAIQTSSPSRQEMVAWLRPMTNDWLPYWQNRAPATSFSPFWGCLWKTYHQQQNDEALVLLSTTSVLCSILPILVEEPLPAVPDDDDTRATPVHQKQMWGLIHTCLRQGIPREPTAAKTDTLTREKEHQILRRRGLYLLRMILAQKEEPNNNNNNSKKKKVQQKQQQATNDDCPLLIWKKYSQVMETLEMETEQHLIEQVWPTLTDVLDACHHLTGQEEIPSSPPQTNWHWVQLLVARVLTSYDQSMIRKLAYYRFLNGQAGFSLQQSQPPSQETNAGAEQDTGGRSSTKSKGRKKKATKKTKAAAVKEGVPVTMMPPRFVCDIVLVSFDSLVGSVGTNINRETEVIDLFPLLSHFLSLYYTSLVDPAQRRELMQRLWERSLLEQLHTKTIVHVWDCLARAVAAQEEQLDMDSKALADVVASLTHLFNNASVMGVYQDSLLRSLATVLRYTATKQIDPKIILQVLSMFDKVILEAERATRTYAELASRNEDALAEIDNTNPIHSFLEQWLSQLGVMAAGNMPWISMVASTVAAAFVRGDLLSFLEETTNEEQNWEPLSGASNLERRTARAISYLAFLVGRRSKTISLSSNTEQTAGELLWPAIHKGLANVPMAMVSTSWVKADIVTRSLLLLEEGCRLQVLSGMGNGNLVVDQKTQQMMPPPPNIESLLESSAKFILHHISFLVADDPTKKQLAGASRSGDAKRASVTFANLISQMRLFYQAYPSSLAVSNIVDQMMATTVDHLIEASLNPAGDIVRDTALVYAALSCGASIPTATSLLHICRLLLTLEFRKIQGKPKSEEQIGRSVFSFAKWGALSCLLPRLVADVGEGSDGKDVQEFLMDFRKIAFNAVHGIPVDAMIAFFHCVVVAGRHELSTSGTQTGSGAEEGAIDVDPTLIGEIIDALMTLMEERMSSQDSNYMLNEFCALIFQPEFLVQEFRRLQRDPSAAETPIRDAYRRLMLMAGTARPRISRVVLCHVTVGWLGANQAGNDRNTQGIGAIGFRQDIMDLLFHKEAKIDIATANQGVEARDSFEGAFELPEGIDESSVGRGYVLLFFSKLPDPEQGLHPDVLKLLVHHTILGLLDKICNNPTTKGSNKLVMLGSEEFIQKIRGWQALCCLSRFVTDEIIESVCKRVFHAMAEALHQQIRYFLEVFTLQIARKHPTVIGYALLEDINRRDLTLQHVTSLMILAGNLIVGRHKLDFFSQYEDGATREAVPLNRILAGTIPWLRSTQGFSRGIAQLLTHTLIPMVVDVRVSKSSDASVAATEDSNWFLVSIYRFLDENQEMKRLREKSSKFFDSYRAEEICTPEGLLTIKVDEGGEACPIHMVETMKQCLQEVYEETHEKDFPQWKSVETMLKDQDYEIHNVSEPSVAGKEDALVNFQRKIIPLDELNLALETLKERRQRNAVGRKKLKLVVCAALIDKVPNLGGLARTAEIFAAEKLVIPDIGITKMDNFKGLSVGAGEFIDIEECKEENLLEYLRSYRARGYLILGIEQTASSVSLESYRFPDQPILLLLGKEKEGIPIEFLQAVDQCLEIPQMGIIRSLNVHVSGAIAIWEHTRQRMGQN